VNDTCLSLRRLRPLVGKCPSSTAPENKSGSLGSGLR
jgi:hypothetical protein